MSSLNRFQQEFIEFLVRSDVLTFGDFTTKSGRQTPYFVNTGMVRTGSQMECFASFYAQSIAERVGDDFDLLFGPAYKGIPLVTAVASCLAREHGIDRGFCFDRKEIKDHGEGGMLVTNDEGLAVGARRVGSLGCASVGGGSGRAAW